jgi:zinc transport system substrate-binding protein
MNVRLILSLVLVPLAGACDAGAGADEAPGDPVTVVASFYPLAHAAERVGGDAVSVTNLTPPGVEPHDLELTPDDLEAIATADVVVYIGGGFQPSIEEAVEAEASGSALDALDGIDLLEPSDHDEHGDSATGDDPVGDPHVWLDPTIYAAIVERVASALGDAAPPAASRVGEAASSFRAELESLDGDFRDGLADCRTRVMITNHAAFGYLAAAYGLDQEAISGIAPESEPDPARIAELAAEAEADGVTTIFTEDLVSADVADTLAREAGLDTAVLSPLEGLTDEQVAAGDDYLSVMQQNLEALRDGLVCT